MRPIPETIPHLLAHRSRWARGLVCAALCALLAACGFHLRGTSPLPFDTIYTNIPDTTLFGARMRRAIMASSPKTHFVPQASDAQARLIELSNHQSLRELSINANGQVEEYELNLVFSFQLTDSKNHLLLPPTTLTTSRDLPYDPSVVQAKQGEIASLFAEMQESMIDRVVRRMTSPDVIKAYQNAGSLPVDENNTNSTTIDRPGGNFETPTPWSGQNAPQPGLF